MLSLIQKSIKRAMKTTKKTAKLPKALLPKEKQLGKALMELFNYAQAGGRIPKDAVLVKNVNERKTTPTKEKKEKVLWKGKYYTKELLDHLYMKGLIAQGMILGLFDYSFMYPVEINSAKLCCVAQIELKRSAKEELSVDQVGYKLRLDEMGCPNIVTHDPERALEFMIKLVNREK